MKLHEVSLIKNKHKKTANQRLAVFMPEYL